MLKLQILYSIHHFPATYQGHGDTSAFPSQRVLVHLLWTQLKDLTLTNQMLEPPNVAFFNVQETCFNVRTDLILSYRDVLVRHMKHDLGHWGEKWGCVLFFLRWILKEIKVRILTFSSEFSTKKETLPFPPQTFCETWDLRVKCFEKCFLGILKNYKRNRVNKVKTDYAFPRKVTDSTKGLRIQNLVSDNKICTTVIQTRYYPVNLRCSTRRWRKQTLIRDLSFLPLYSTARIHAVWGNPRASGTVQLSCILIDSTLMKR